MNRTLKIAMATAIATLAVAGQAHALTASGVSTSGSLFLYAFEDRTVNPTATNGAVFDLGLASSFNTGASQTFDFSASSDWKTYIASIANPANIHWGVVGVAQGVGGTGSQFMTTLAAVPAPVNGTAVGGAVVKYNTEAGVYASVNGYNAVTVNDLASTTWANLAGGMMPTTLTSTMGNNLDFYKYTSTGSKASSLATQLNYVSAADGSANYFNLSNTGVLTYNVATATAPVPEADTAALMLAGLGLVGFLARRRKV